MKMILTTCFDLDLDLFALVTIPFGIDAEVEDSLSKKALARADIAGKASRNGGRGLLEYLLDIRMILSGKISKQDVKVCSAFARSIHRLTNVGQINDTIDRIIARSRTTALVVSSPSHYQRAQRRSKKRRSYSEIFEPLRPGRPLKPKANPSLPDRKFPVIYLKAALSLLHQALAGTSLVKSTMELGAPIRLAGSKIPNIIPSSERKELRMKRKGAIQFWLSALSFYRVFPLKGEASLNTVEFGSGLPDNFNYSEGWGKSASLHFFRAFPGGWGNLANDGQNAIKDLGLPKPFIMEKSGPAGSTLINTALAPLALALDAWKGDISRIGVQIAPGVYAKPVWPKRWDPTINDWVDGGEVVNYFPDRSSLLYRWYDLFVSREQSLSEGVLHPGHPWMEYSPAVTTRANMQKFMSDLSNKTVQSMESYLDKIPHCLGKLALLPEPAGKVRVIAMVDAWTQWALAPLHDAIFKKLKYIGSDGTFDQTKALHQLRKWMVANKTNYLASYDLSAATDCLPLRLQKEILAVWLGPSVADMWGDLLVDRGYWLSKFMAGGYGLESKFYHYGVGQPMGALSSWAMLALTHHVIVQLAAYTVGVTQYEGKDAWFSGYALLGDDIQIADRRVGDAYLKLMALLGVKVGLHKSVISERGFGEFAKKFSNRDRGIYTMVPIKQLLVSKMDGSTLTALGSQFNLPHKVMLALRGKRHSARGMLHRGYRKSPRWVKGLLLYRTRPAAWNFESLRSWLRMVSPSKTSHLEHPDIFREEVIKLWIHWHNKLVDLRKSLATTPILSGKPEEVEEYWDSVRAGFPIGPHERVYPLVSDKLTSDQRGFPSVLRAPGVYEPNRFVGLVHGLLIEPVLLKRRHDLDQAIFRAHSEFRAISQSKGSNVDLFVTSLLTLLEEKKKIHGTRAQAAWQLRREEVISREDFLGIHRLYNSTEGIRSYTSQKFIRSLNGPFEIRSFDELKYPIGELDMENKPVKREPMAAKYKQPSLEYILDVPEFEVGPDGTWMPKWAPYSSPPATAEPRLFGARLPRGNERSQEKPGSDPTHKGYIPPKAKPWWWKGPPYTRER